MDLPDIAEMSVSRRRFLVFATFDLIFSSVLWIILTVTSGGNLKDAFAKQIELSPQEFLKLSLFDTVVLALIRFLVLIVFYAVLKWNHWVPICICVCVTSLYMVLKILYFKFHASGLEYALIVCCFVIPWVELYVFDFKVRRSEQASAAVIDQANLLANDQLSNSNAGNSGSRNPRFASDDPFFSAIEYTTDNLSSSDDDDMLASNPRHGLFGGWRKKSTAKRKHRIPKSITVEDKLVSPVDFIRFSHNAMSVSRSLLQTVNLWTGVRNEKPFIAFKNHDTYGKMYFVQDVLNCSRDQLFTLLVTNAALAPEWNPALSESRVLRVIDQATDVIYNVSNPTLGGAVSARDYVDVRRWENVNSTIFCALMSANLDLMPERQGRVRGKNGPTLIVISPVDANRCSYKWIMNTSIKGRLPTRLVDKALAGFIISYMNSMHAEVDRLNSSFCQENVIINI